MCPTISNALVSSNMGSTWRQGFIDLSSYKNETNVMFRFLGTTGSSYDSDVCLDDIKLVDAQNTSVDVGENISLDANSYSNAYGLVLNGASAQNITSNGYNISNITINNANGITIDGDLKIDGILDLISGVITTGTDKIEITAPVPSAITGGSNTAFINGTLKRYIPSPSSGTFEFPIGNGTGTGNYHKVDLINSSLSGVNYITANVDAMPSGSYGDLNAHQLGSPLVEVFDKQWQLIPDVQPSGGSYGVNLYLNGVAGAFMQDDNFTIIKRNDNSTTWADWDTYEATTTIPNAGDPGRTIASGYGQKLGFNSFSLFGFGGTGGSALPIDLLSFTAELLLEMDPIVLLRWEVASQVNNDYYEIQRSVDVESWTTIEKVTGAGNSNTHISYSIIDDNPILGISYYRLKQTDYDGMFETFQPISMIISSTEKIIDKVYNLMGQEVDDTYEGVVIEVYQDGTSMKKYKLNQQ